MNTSIGRSRGKLASRMRSAMPSRRNISIVRALQRSIFGNFAGAALRSNKTHGTLRWPRSMASVKPTGPAPTMITSVSILGVCRRVPARGALESFRGDLGKTPVIGIPRDRRFPVFRLADPVRRVVDLLDLGRVLDRKLVGIEKVREDVVAGTVAPDAPFDRGSVT